MSASCKNRVYIGLGSNLGDSQSFLCRALALLDEEPGIQVVAASRMYETEPVGPVDQEWFLNAAAELKVELGPRELLERTKAIESELGRKRDVPWGPRTIDLDILLYGDEVIDEQHLKVPHPLIPQRRFVLEPLAEIAPEAVHPTLGLTMQDLLAACEDESGVRPAAFVERDCWSRYRK